MSAQPANPERSANVLFTAAGTKARTCCEKLGLATNSTLIAVREHSASTVMLRVMSRERVSLGRPALSRSFATACSPFRSEAVPRPSLAPLSIQPEFAV
jgi:hypothetical protein